MIRRVFWGREGRTAGGSLPKKARWSLCRQSLTLVELLPSQQKSVFWRVSSYITSFPPRSILIAQMLKMDVLGIKVCIRGQENQLDQYLDRAQKRIKVEETYHQQPSWKLP